MPNNRINSDWQFRYAPLPAGYAGRSADRKRSAERAADSYPLFRPPAASEPADATDMSRRKLRFRRSIRLIRRPLDARRFILNEISINCSKCNIDYTLGRDALVVSASSVFDGFKYKTIFIDKNYGHRQSAPDLVSSLTVGWYFLDARAKTEQSRTVSEIVLDVSRGVLRQWRCHTCDTIYTYNLRPVEPLKEKRFIGKSIKEVIDSAINSVEKKHIVAIYIIKDNEIKYAEGSGRNISDAIQIARSQIPIGSIRSSDGEIISNLEEGTDSVYALTEEEALNIWRQTKHKEAYSEKIQCENVPRKGFLGIGNKPGKWIIR